MSTGRRLALLVVIVQLGACSAQVRLGYFDKDRREAEAAMDTFHQRLGSGQLQSIYDDADSALRATASKETLLSSMRATHEQFGAFVGSEVKVASCFPNEVRLVCHTEYEKGKATEIFTWSIGTDGKARLRMLQISPGVAEVPTGAGNDCKSQT